jgi:hypothetical protein
MANVNAYAVDPASSGAQLTIAGYGVDPAVGGAQVGMEGYALDPAPGTLGATCPPWYAQILREVPYLTRRWPRREV